VYSLCNLETNLPSERARYVKKQEAVAIKKISSLVMGLKGETDTTKN
jgi:hypothetical protein